MLAAEEVNALGTLKLAQACHHAKIRHLVQISSIYAGLSEASSFTAAMRFQSGMVRNWPSYIVAASAYR